MSSVFTERDVKEMARQVVDEVINRVIPDLRREWNKDVKFHASDCPVKKEVSSLVNQGRGIGKTVAVIVAILASAAAVSATIASVFGR